MSTPPDAAPMSQAAEAAPASAGAYAEPASHLRWRHVKDGTRAVAWSAIGGVAVLGSLLLIFVYLLVEVLPLFASARAEPRSEFRVPGGAGATAAPRARGAVRDRPARVRPPARPTFFDLSSGAVREQSASRSAIAASSRHARRARQGRPRRRPVRRLGAAVQAHLRRELPGRQARHRPGHRVPQGEAPLPFMSEPPRSLVVRKDGDRLLFAAVDAAAAHSPAHDRGDHQPARRNHA